MRIPIAAFGSDGFGLARPAPSAPPGPAPGEDMAWVPGGTFLMGSDRHYPEEAPARPASTPGFWMDRTPVTNERFAAFAEATGYATVAERELDPAAFPGVPADALVPGSLLFEQPPGPVPLSDYSRWWRFAPGVSWRRPDGPGSDWRDRRAHPVVHVAYEDAAAYAAWAGKSIPTETEWEFAAWGGSRTPGAEFPWGADFAPGGRHRANTWQGEFPWHNAASDGFERTSPVGAYPPNGYGLVDMIGNVWEWTASAYASRQETSGCCAPSGTARPHDLHALKGGSFLCAPGYCRRYRPPARSPQSPDSSTSHIGFRCVVRPR